jgi:hypothetical protein
MKPPFVRDNRRAEKKFPHGHLTGPHFMAAYSKVEVVRMGHDCLFRSRYFVIRRE